MRTTRKTKAPSSKKRRAALFALAMAGAISLNPVYSAHAQSNSANINNRATSVNSGAAADINTRVNPGNVNLGANVGSAARIADPVTGIRAPIDATSDTRARLDSNRDGAVNSRDMRTPDAAARINTTASENNDASSGTLRAEADGNAAVGTTNANRSDINTRMRSDLRGATPGSVSGAGVRVNGSTTATTGR